MSRGNHTGKGGFKPGRSGNPGGRPKGYAEIIAAARSHGEAALKVLVAALKAKDPRLRVIAAQTLLDRGYGKPAQTVAVVKSPLDDVDPATLAALAEALGLAEADISPPVQPADGTS